MLEGSSYQGAGTLGTTGSDDHSTMVSLDTMVQWQGFSALYTLTRMRELLIAASIWFLVTSAARPQSLNEASLRWSNPTTLPLGALAAVASGDPRAPGVSTILLSMPNGYRVGAHHHPGYEHLEVREGTLLVGMGDVPDPKRTRRLVAGDSLTVPAGKHHYWIARGRRTILALTFSGPYTITYLRADDAPRPRNFPFGY
jgi:quercetin dioxygenase-like cupin family protein